MYIAKSNSYGFFEVEEIESAGNMVKVKLHNVSTSDKDNISKIKDKFKEWVDSKSVIWYDSNSQKIRNNKLSNILDDNI